MSQRSVVIAAAWFEIAVGVIFLTMPDIPCQLLFAARPEGVSMPLARFAGVGLAALGLACVPAAATGLRRGAVLALFVFNVGVAILFALVGVNKALRAFLLWPAVILHAAIAAALLPQALDNIGKKPIP